MNKKKMKVHVDIIIHDEVEVEVSDNADLEEIEEKASDKISDYMSGDKYSGYSFDCKVVGLE